MRLTMVGGHGFGRAVAKALIEDGHEIAVVMTEDEKMRELCEGAGAWPSKDSRMVVETKSEVLVSAHNHWWIPEEVLSAHPVGGLGYHPSLLPRHRGKDSIRWTIHMADPVAGGTVYRMEGDEADTGPIVLQDWCHVVPGWTASDLWREELFPMGVRLLRQAVRTAEASGLACEPQDERVATWEPAWDRPPLREVGA